MKQLIFTLSFLLINTLSFSQTCFKTDTIDIYEKETLQLEAAYDWDFPLTFKWKKDGIALPLSDSILTIADLKLSDAGYYECEIQCNTWPAPIFYCYDVSVLELGIYPLEELLIDFKDMDDAVQKKAELEEMGMKVKESCLCGDLELWEVNPDSIHLDVEEVVRKASGTLSEEASSKNYHFETPDPEACLGDQQVQWSALKDVANPSSSPILVAVMDNGFDASFPGIAGNTWINPTNNSDPIACCADNKTANGYNAVAPCTNITPRKHGTAVASIIGNYSPKNVPLEMMNIKVKRGKKKGNLFKFACGVRYAIDAGAAVINISMGYYGEESPLLKKVIAQANAADILVVTSAGNGGKRKKNHWPSCFSKAFANVISVGAVNQADGKMDFSNDADIYALGHNLFFDNGPNNTFVKSGTSFSAAFVTGASVSILAENPTMKPLDIINELMTKEKYSRQATVRFLPVDFKPAQNPLSSNDFIWISFPLLEETEQEFIANEEVRLTSTANPSSITVVKAGTQVRFEPGFTAIEGCYLNALIGGCNPIPPTDAPPSAARQANSDEILSPKEEEEERFIKKEVARIGETKAESSNPDFLVYPNPFSAQATLRFTLGKPAFVQLQIQNALGQVIQIIENNSKTAGVHSYKFLAGELPAGMYFAALRVGDQVFIRKMVLR